MTLGSNRVLNGLSLTAQASEITCILGPNGAGKTTMIRCCTGLLTPTDGTIRVLDSMPGAATLRARVGLMPQSAGAWSGVHAGELLRHLASLYATPQPVDQLMELLGISDFAKTPYRRLSGGQQQLVNLAGAIVGRPELVFLDEPTSGMDPRVRRNTWQIIKSLRDAGVAVVCTTHGMDEATKLADRVYIMSAGKIAVSGTVPELTKAGSLEDAFLRHTEESR